MARLAASPMGASHASSPLARPESARQPGTPRTSGVRALFQPAQPGLLPRPSCAPATQHAGDVGKTDPSAETRHGREPGDDRLSRRGLIRRACREAVGACAATPRYVRLAEVIRDSGMPAFAHLGISHHLCQAGIGVFFERRAGGESRAKSGFRTYSLTIPCASNIGYVLPNMYRRTPGSMTDFDPP